MIRRVARAFLLRFRRCRRALRGFRYRLHLHLQRLAGFVEVQGCCQAEVPLVADGSGTVILADGVCLGFWMAPSSGAGEIRLQARCQSSSIHIGEGSRLSNNVTVIAVQAVRIGNRTRIGDHVLILDSDFHHLDAGRRDAPSPPSAPVLIGDDVWLGSRVTVLKGARIGARSVIAAGAVVTGEIPPDSIAGGIPARVLRTLDSQLPPSSTVPSP